MKFGGGKRVMARGRPRIAIGCEEPLRVPGAGRAATIEHPHRGRQKDRNIGAGIARGRALPVDEDGAVRPDDDVRRNGIAVQKHRCGVGRYLWRVGAQGREAPRLRAGALLQKPGARVDQGCRGAIDAAQTRGRGRLVKGAERTGRLCHVARPVRAFDPGVKDPRTRVARTARHQPRREGRKGGVGQTDRLGLGIVGKKRIAPVPGIKLQDKVAPLPDQPPRPVGAPAAQPFDDRPGRKTAKIAQLSQDLWRRPLPGFRRGRPLRRI